MPTSTASTRGPEGTFQVVTWTLQSFFERDLGAMRDLTATFKFPAVHQSGVSRRHRSPAGAGVADSATRAADLDGQQPRLPSDGARGLGGGPASGGAFDLEATHRSIGVGVVAEEGSLGTPEAVRNFVQNNLRKVSINPEFSQAYAVRIDGRDWLQFSAKCQIKNIPLAYRYFVYAGSEGSFRVVCWTMQNLYDRDADTMRDVAMTFQFPPPAATPMPTAALASPAAATSAPLGSPSPTPRKTKHR